MEKPSDMPKLSFRDIVRGMLKGTAHIGGGMAQIGEGQYRIAQGMSRIGLSHTVESEQPTDLAANEHEPGYSKAAPPEPSDLA